MRPNQQSWQNDKKGKTGSYRSVHFGYKMQPMTDPSCTSSHGATYLPFRAVVGYYQDFYQDFFTVGNPGSRLLRGCGLTGTT